MAVKRALLDENFWITLQNHAQNPPSQEQDSNAHGIKERPLGKERLQSTRALSSCCVVRHVCSKKSYIIVF